MSLLSIVILLTKNTKKSDSLQRLNQVMEGFSDHGNVDIVVYDTSSHPLESSMMPVLGLQNLHYSHRDDAKTSPGESLNHAVDQASGRYILLLNPDVLASRSLISALLAYIPTMEEEGGHAFSLHPSITLSPFVYDRLYNTDQLPESFEMTQQGFLKGGQIREGGHLELLSGGILLRRHWYTALGGCRDAFDSYEYTLFDLVHRLAAYLPLCQKPEDYTVNVVSGVPAGQLGFRRYFSLYALPQLLNGKFFVRRRDAGWGESSEQDIQRFSQILSQSAAGCRSLKHGNIKASSELGQRMLQTPFDTNKPMPTLEHYIVSLATHYGIRKENYQGLFAADHCAGTQESHWLKRLLKRIYKVPSRWLSRTAA